MGDNEKSREKRTKPWILVLLLLLIGVVVLAIIRPNVFPEWTGLPQFDPGTSGLVRQKTLWDWLDLFIVSSVVAFGLFWLRSREDRRQQERRDDEKKGQEQKQEQEKARQLDNQHDAALNHYFDSMSTLILDYGLGREEQEGSLDLARLRTVTLLRRLDTTKVDSDKDRLGEVFRFLDNAGLKHKVSLANENLTHVKWKGGELRTANLQGANLRKADLRSANMRRVWLNGATLRKACLNGADMRAADLRGANLEEADLRGADLGSTNVTFAELTGIDAMDEIDKLPDAVVREVYRRLEQVREAEWPEIDAMRKIIQEKAESTDEYPREADLLGARLNGAVYDSETKWPKHFDPDAEGAAKGDQGTNSTAIRRPCED